MFNNNRINSSYFDSIKPCFLPSRPFAKEIGGTDRYEDILYKILSVILFNVRWQQKKWKSLVNVRMRNKRDKTKTKLLYCRISNQQYFIDLLLYEYIES